MSVKLNKISWILGSLVLYMPQSALMVRVATWDPRVLKWLDPFPGPKIKKKLLLMTLSHLPPHIVLQHLDKRNTYVRMLFVHHSSAFNTIIPSKLFVKL